jgi:hypothetical protein
MGTTRKQTNGLGIGPSRKVLKQQVFLWLLLLLLLSLVLFLFRLAALTVTGDSFEAHRLLRIWP